MIKWTDRIRVQRTKEGSYQLGEYVEAKATELDFIANVQPHFFKEHLREMEGRRTNDAIKIYSKEQLFISSGNQRADIVIYNNKKYEVYQVKDYNYTQLARNSHYKSIAILVDEVSQ